MTERVNHLVDVAASFHPQTDGAPAVEMPRQNFAQQCAGRTFESYALTRLQLLPRVHQRIEKPNICRRIDTCRPTNCCARQLVACARICRRFLSWSKQKALDSAAARNPTAEQASGHHPRVVHNQHITGNED